MAPQHPDWHYPDEPAKEELDPRIRALAEELDRAVEDERKSFRSLNQEPI